MVYLITYDINTAVNRYDSLYEEIKLLGDSYYHPLESVWFISCGYSRYNDVHAITDRLKRKLDVRDSIFVTEINPEDRMDGWLPKSFWEWLKDNMRR